MSDEPKIPEPQVWRLGNQLVVRKEDYDSLRARVEELERERDQARRTNCFYASALYFPGIRQCAVPGGDDAVEIKPERISEIVNENARLSREIERLREDAEKWRAYVKAHHF